MLKPSIGIYGVYEKSEEGWENAHSLISTVRENLNRAGMDAQAAPELVCDDDTALKAAHFFQRENPDILLAVIVSWSFDHLTLRILKNYSRPLAILAVPGIRSGSLVGAQQLGCLLTELGVEHAGFFGPSEDLSTYKPVIAYTKATAAKRQLELGKLAYIGTRTPGMTPIAFDEVEVTRLLGPQVVTYGWDEIDKSAKGISSTRVVEQIDQIRSLAACVESTEESLSETARFYLTIRDLIDREGLLAVSFGCYPHYAGKVCVVCSLLGDEGIPASCEGDLNSGLAMYLLQAFTNQPVHFGEMLEIDEEGNSVVTSHCGCCPSTLACSPSEIQVKPVRLFERGASVRFPAKGGSATFVNLVGRRGTYRLCAAQGTAIVTEMVFEGNPVKIKLDSPVRDLLEVVYEKGFGHHWMMGYGRVNAELEYFCRISGVQGTFL